jgi:uncharacterized membrane protein HdeD (DUF308 family)
MTNLICSPQFALGISLLALGLTMITWGFDKTNEAKNKHKKSLNKMGKFYMLSGFVLIVACGLVFSMLTCS